MTCKDCIHDDVCEGMGQGELPKDVNSEDVRDLCSHFKNKADLVEVVKCEKCKKAKPLIFDGFYFCRRYRVCRKADAFCSDGERRAEE